MPSGKPFKPTDDQRVTVARMAANGLTHQDIAYYLGIEKDTLRRHFRYELDTGLAQANDKMATKLFEMGMAGDTTAVIFWLKTRAKWSTVVDMNITHKTEEVKKIEQHMERMTFEQIQEMRQLLTIENDTGLEVPEE